MKATGKLIALAMMAEAFSQPTTNVKKGVNYSKTPLSKKAKKQRAKNKSAKQSRKKNR